MFMISWGQDNSAGNPGQDKILIDMVEFVRFINTKISKVGVVKKIFSANNKNQLIGGSE
jgi:hypothetical protein